MNRVENIDTDVLMHYILNNDRKDIEISNEGKFHIDSYLISHSQSRSSDEYLKTEIHVFASIYLNKNKETETVSFFLTEDGNIRSRDFRYSSKIIRYLEIFFPNTELRYKEPSVE